MKKKHLVFFISSLQKGGSERVLVNLAQYFHSQEYRVTIVTQYRAPNEYGIDPEIKRVISEVDEQQLGKNRILNFAKRFCKLRQIWKKEKPDLILSFIGKNNVMALLTSRLLYIPVVVSVRGEPAEEYNSKMLFLAARFFFGFADGIVMQTKQSLEFFPKKITDKSIVLHNSLSPAFLQPIGEGPREKSIVAVGRVDANKNHEMLIEAFADLGECGRDYELFIYGEGVLRQTLLDKVTALGLEARVFLPGGVEDVPMAIKSASIFVLTSYSEGMPNTLLEAMALGITVIATNCAGGGPAELIADGVNGLLIPPGDKKALTDALEHLITDEEYKNQLGICGRKVREIYHPQKINESWKVYFERLMRK